MFRIKPKLKRPHAAPFNLLLHPQTHKGDLLDDEDLIKILRKSDVTSEEVSDRLKASEKNEQRMEVARRKYLPVATRGAVLYFVIAELEGLNPMYQFSLQWFSLMFTKCIGE